MNIIRGIHLYMLPHATIHISYYLFILKIHIVILLYYMYACFLLLYYYYYITTLLLLLMIHKRYMI